MFEDIENGIVEIGGDYYVKSPEALEALLTRVREVGYRIDDLRQDNSRKERGVSVETMEQKGWSLWFAAIDVRHGKCGSCHELISCKGIQSHGHKCEWCGAVTYYEIMDGSTIRFSFIEKEGGERGFVDLTMTAKRWDAENGFLYLYPEVLEGLWCDEEKAKQYFEDNRDKWEEVTENDHAT